MSNLPLDICQHCLVPKPRNQSCSYCNHVNWFPRIAKRSDVAKMSADDIDETTKLPNPVQGNLDDFYWDFESNGYKKKTEEKNSTWAPKKCECGIAVLGYVDGHSDWCPISPNYKESK